MESIKLVKLKNGSEEPITLVNLVFRVLENLLNNEVMVFIELVCKCRNPQHKLLVGEKRLQELSLMENGIIHNSIRNIVLSSIEGEGLGLCLISPVAESEEV